MPVPLKVADVTNMAYNGSDTGAWTASIYSDDLGSVVNFGSFNNVGDTYTDGSEVVSPISVFIYFDFGADAISLSEGETITVDYDGKTVNLYLPAFTGANGDKVWYIDSNGLLYEDRELTILASPDSAINNESLLSSDDSMPSGSSEDVVSAGEDNDGFPDGFTSDLITFIEDSDGGYEDEYEDVVSVKDSTYIASPVYYDDVVRLVEIPDEWPEVLYSDLISLSEDSSGGLGAIYRYTDNIDVVEDFDVDQLVGDIIQGVQIGEVIGVSPTLVEDRTFIVIDKFDMMYKGIKLIESIEVGADRVSGVEVSIAFRYSSDESWRYTSWIPVNKQGVVRTGIAGVEFKVLIRSLAGKFVPTYVRVNWKALDKRFIRSRYVTSKEN